MKKFARRTNKGSGRRSDGIQRADCPTTAIMRGGHALSLPATLEMDADKYLSQLAESDLTEAQKLERLQTLWSIVKGFVEMGFSVDICAKLFDDFNAVSAPAHGALIDTSVPTVITAYEERIGKLELDKALVREKMATQSRPASTFDDTLRTAMEFLANPWKLWDSKRLESRRAVLKLTFADHLRYKRNEGFRTVDLSLPFKVLDGFLGGEREMARLDVETSNELFEVLADWNDTLTHLKINDLQVPPCP